MAASDRSIRASDADREQVAASLRDHFTAGRLTNDEFNERLGQAYAATTLGDLDDLQTDLPASPSPSQFPVPDPNQFPAPMQAPGPVMAGPGRFPERWRSAVGSWLSISLALFVVWLLSGRDANLWFLWPVGIVGALTIGRLVSGAPPGSSGRRYRRDYRRQRRGY